MFTCLTTRVVHIKVPGDLSTDSFILVYCDNYEKAFDKYYKGQTYDLCSIGDVFSRNRS